MLLKGKTKTNYTPHVDCGDNVVIINAEKVRLTGDKLEDKIYLTHSGYPGGLHEVEYQRQLETHPDRIIRFAVRGMLPKNRLTARYLDNLKIYAGSEHPHQGQNPQPILEK